MRASSFVLLWLRQIAAQPPYNPSVFLGGVELPGNPRPVRALNGDGQDCAFQCTAVANCTAFNYAPQTCKREGCPFASGCCWLLSSASSLNTSATCAGAGSMMMRPAPGSVPPLPSPPPLPAGARNVLYILVDDLRPDVAPYGASWMVTPNLQALARNASVFTNAYTNIAVCSPSRMSFLTGRYPHHTLTWNFVNHFRQADCAETPDRGITGRHYKQLTVLNGGAAQCCTFCTAENGTCAAWTYEVSSGVCSLHSNPNGDAPAKGYIFGRCGRLDRRGWTSLPQWFTEHGWLTAGTGKIFHTEEGGDGPQPWDGPGAGMPPLQDPPSWSRGNYSMAAVNGLAPMRPCSGAGCSVNATREGLVPDGTFQLCDRIIGDDGVAKLQAAAANYKSTGQPFFLAVGFRKPHLPFRHPAPWNDDYPVLADIPLAKYNTMNRTTPPVAYHSTSIATNPYVPIPDAQAQQLRRDYYASISWVDWNIGRLLTELKQLGVDNKTIIAFHADHGWSLGEAGEWEKFTNWEFGTRVPLIIRAPDVPGSAGRNVSDIVSLVDVFPTLAELAGIPVPSSDHLDGTSLAPLLNSSAPANASAYALSVYPRCPASANASLYWQDNDCMTTERTAFRFMGLSLRTPRWRYTEWLPWNASLQADWYTPGAAAGVELYDHAGDDGTTFDGPWEQANLAGDPAHAAVQAQLAATLHAVYPNTPAWQ